MRETLLDLMIRFNEENMLDPWNENEEELDDLGDLLGSYRRGTLGSYQAGTREITAGPNTGQRQSTNALGQPVYLGGQTFGSAGAEAMAQSQGFGPNAQGQVTTPTAGAPAAGAPAGGGVGGTGTPEQTASTLAGYGAGLMEPGSDLSKRWMEQMREDVGKGTDAAQRAAAYQAAQSGFGGGVSPELLQMQGDIGIAGREAAGDAASDYLLRAPEMGIGAMGGALGNQVGMRGQDLTSRIESNRAGARREEIQFQERQRQQERDEERRRWDEQRQWDLEDQAKAEELAALYQGYDTGEGGGGGGAYQPPAQPRYGGFRLGAR